MRYWVNHSIGFKIKNRFHSMKYMFLNRFSLIGAAVLGAMTASAATITGNVAGQLSTAVGTNVDDTQLTVTGAVDGADLKFIASEMKNLRKVDLSGAVLLEAAGSAEIPQYALFGASFSEFHMPKGVTAIGEAAFASSNIQSITIPSTVKNIGRCAFDNCDALTQITIPATVTGLGQQMFRDCDRLTTAIVDAAVDNVGAEMFYNCGALTSATYGAAIKTIGDHAFEGCAKLESFDFPASLESIGKEAFYGSGLTSADMSLCGSLTTIGDFAFAKCQQLNSVSLKSVAKLGRGAFFDDYSLTDIKLPESLTVIPSFTFKGTNSLQPTAIADNVTEIGDYALTGWDQVDEFKLPSQLKHIGTNAMEGWTSLFALKGAELETVPSLGESVWENVEQPDVILYVNSSTKDKFESSPQWQNFDIRVEQSDINTLLPDDPASSSSVVIRLVDRALVIDSPSCSINTTTVYDIDGRRRYSAASSANRVVIDTTAWGSSVFIVNVKLEDKSETSAKIAIK